MANHGGPSYTRFEWLPHSLRSSALGFSCGEWLDMTVCILHVDTYHEFDNHYQTVFVSGGVLYESRFILRTSYWQY